VKAEWELPLEVTSGHFQDSNAHTGLEDVGVTALQKLAKFLENPTGDHQHNPLSG
jgi:hypothetical protein